MKKRVFSGSRPTGRLHLGNYLGGVKGYLELQDNPNYETIYMVMDLHAVTTPYDKETLAKNTRQVVVDYLACGLDPAKSTITVQSLVPEQTYLAHLLSSTVTVARMLHLPTYKEKIKQHPGGATVALLNYPVLMAADILAYKAELVPVGLDQEPHLEVSREIARKMNEKYGLSFPEPTRFATKGEYVPSLTGEGKMSKTVEGSYISLGDSLSEIKAKLAKVPTDLGKGKAVPKKGGVAALLQLVEVFLGEEERESYEKAYLSEGIRYQELKSRLAYAIYEQVRSIQEKAREIESKKSFVDEVIYEGAKKARKIASSVLEEVREKMGFYFKKNG